MALSAGVLRVADFIGESVLSTISRLLFTLARWGIRVICLGYSLIAALMGTAAAGMDSLLLRTGRAAAGSLPMVGSLVSDSLGAMTACLGLVKGALGRTGMLLVALLLRRSCSFMVLALDWYPPCWAPWSSGRWGACWAP